MNVCFVGVGELVVAMKLIWERTMQGKKRWVPDESFDRFVDER